MVVHGLGHVPGKKNSKMMVRAKGKGRALLIIKPEIQQWIRHFEKLLASQLLSAFRTDVGATSPTAPTPSWIRSSLPLDDCWEIVPSLGLSGEWCEKGNEGCTITIKPL